MTAIQNQYNELLNEKAKIAETERTNRANEQIRAKQAAAAEKQANSSARQASVAESQFLLGKTGPLGLIEDLLSKILKIVL